MHAKKSTPFVPKSVGSFVESRFLRTELPPGVWRLRRRGGATSRLQRRGGYGAAHGALRFAVGAVGAGKPPASLDPRLHVPYNENQILLGF